MPLQGSVTHQIEKGLISPVKYNHQKKDTHVLVNLLFNGNTNKNNTNNVYMLVKHYNMHASPWLRHKPVFRTAHEKFYCQMSGMLQQQCWKFQQIIPTNFTLTWPDRSNFCRVAIQYWNLCKQVSALWKFLIHSCFARGFNIQLFANFYDQTAKKEKCKDFN